jgi:hypothetical protein
MNRTPVTMYYRVSDLRAMFRVSESHIRRIFIAGRSPLNWFWAPSWPAPRWAITCTTEWALALSKTDPAKLPPDPGKWEHSGQTEGMPGPTPDELAFARKICGIRSAGRNSG